MKVTVLAGGPSSEREVSLKSGRCVTNALQQAGHDATLCDITPTDLSALDQPADVIFPVLHGVWGESGELQEILEARGLPFVGSGSAASRMGMDKFNTKQAWLAAGIPTPICQLVTSPDIAFAPHDCVVKSVDGGSSIDVFICRRSKDGQADVHRPVNYLLAKYGKCLVEQFVEGVELTVGILNGQPLPPIWIDAGENQWFDFNSKYGQNGAKHCFDLPIPAETAGEIQQICLQAHRVIGCRDLSRIDLIVDKQNRPWLLEINTMPGFTDRSLLPDAARQSGIAFPDLVDGLVRRAAARPAVAA